jgi:cell division protease FtsH
MATEFGMSPVLGPVRLAGDPQAAFLGPQAWGLDSRVSQETASQVDAETRRLVEEALDSASALLSGHRVTLDRLAERLREHETVNGSEVTAMLADASTEEDGNAIPDDSAAPNGGPWQDASLWHAWPENARAVQHVDLADGVPAGKASFGNGHEPPQTLSGE